MNWALSPEGQTVLCGLELAAVHPADPSCTTVSDNHVSPRDSMPEADQTRLLGLLGLTP